MNARKIGRQDRLARRARTQSGGFECLVNMYSVIDVSPPDDYPSWCIRGDSCTRVRVLLRFSTRA